MSDYIKLFNTVEDQNEFLNSGGYIWPHVSCTADGNNLKYNTVINLEPVDIGIPEFYVANCNLGATHPMDLGSTFAWGEIVPKETYTWDNYKWGTADNLTKYNSTDNKTELDSEDDAATVILGEHWRIPTYNEFKNKIMHSSSNTTFEVNGGANENSDYYLPYMKVINNTTGAYIIIPKSAYYLTSTLYSADLTKYRTVTRNILPNIIDRYRASYIRPIYIP